MKSMEKVTERIKADAKNRRTYSAEGERFGHSHDGKTYSEQFEKEIRFPLTLEAKAEIERYLEACKSNGDIPAATDEKFDAADMEWGVVEPIDFKHSLEAYKLKLALSKYQHSLAKAKEKNRKSSAKIAYLTRSNNYAIGRLNEAERRIGNIVRRNSIDKEDLRYQLARARNQAFMFALLFGMATMLLALLIAKSFFI